MQRWTSLTLANSNVYAFTIKKTLNSSGRHGRVLEENCWSPKRTLLPVYSSLKRSHGQARRLLDKFRGWIGPTKYVWKKENIRTLSHLWNMELVWSWYVSWFRPVLHYGWNNKFWIIPVNSRIKFHLCIYWIPRDGHASLSTNEFKKSSFGVVKSKSWP